MVINLGETNNDETQEKASLNFNKVTHILYTIMFCA